MRYVSTRDKSVKVTSSEAIVRGLAPDGGLYTPEQVPVCPGLWEELLDKTYAERASRVMGCFLDDFDADELSIFSNLAYGADRFTHADVAPVRPLGDNVHVLELWHGPTSAFKDMALQMLPRLLTSSLKRLGETREVLILTATSGDTGKAALEGFHDVPGTRILVFYPSKGVSRVQELQMVTQEGANVSVSAVKGNFDDAQNGVKQLFSNQAVAGKLSERGFFFSSANSINLGRLVPQIAYYFSGYCDMVRQNSVEPGQAINICVPTGNFGNILSALFAWEMGLPVAKLICASNQNNVLTDFIQTGTYDRRRAFYNTLSPSMDILVSSNLERALFLLSGGSDATVHTCMRSLSEIGRYTLPRALKQTFESRFYAGFCRDEQTKQCIGEVYRDEGYLIDPHTAVAVHVTKQYRRETGDSAPVLLASTASPFKFCDAVLSALGEPAEAEGADLLHRLSQFTGLPVPEPLRGLSDRPIRFSGSLPTSDMERAVWSFLEKN